MTPRFLFSSTSSNDIPKGFVIFTLMNFDGSNFNAIDSDDDDEDIDDNEDSDDDRKLVTLCNITNNIRIDNDVIIFTTIAPIHL